jgi:hypothetical protein
MTQKQPNWLVLLHYTVFLLVTSQGLLQAVLSAFSHVLHRVLLLAKVLLSFHSTLGGLSVALVSLEPQDGECNSTLS